MKRTLTFIVAILALTLCFVGCAGSSSKDMGYTSDYNYAVDAPSAEYYGWDANVEAEESVTAADNAANGGLDSAMSERKIIKDASITVQTLEFDTFLAELEAQISSFGGYISSNEVNGNSYNSSRLRGAFVTARIPAEKLDAFLDTVGGMGNVTYKSESQRDVTTSYVDTEAHLESLRTEQEALMGILAAAETVEDLITVQNRLSEVRYEIESYEATIRSYDSLIAYSTVTMTVSEVERETPVTEETSGEKMSRMFKESLEDVGEGFADFAVWFVGNLPAIIVILVIFGGIPLLIVLLCDSAGKKRRAKKAAKLLAEQKNAVVIEQQTENEKAEQP